MNLLCRSLDNGENNRNLTVPGIASNVNENLLKQLEGMED